MRYRRFFYNSDAMSLVFGQFLPWQSVQFLLVNHWERLFLFLPIYGPMLGDEIWWETLQTAFFTTCSNLRQIVRISVLWGKKTSKQRGNNALGGKIIFLGLIRHLWD